MKRAAPHAAAKKADAAEIARLTTALRAAEAERDQALAREAVAGERQAATFEILGVISSSPAELGPVFDTILAKALELCQAEMGHVYRCDGDRLHRVAMRGATPAYAEWMRTHPENTAGHKVVLDMARQERRPFEVPDLKQHALYAAGDPTVVAAVDLGGTRTLLWVPMLKEDEVVGLMAIYRREVRSFEQKHLDLLSGFARQAVIAIENARLLGEIKEALANQTASAEVLRTIAGTPAEAERALDTIAEVAARRFDAASVNVLRLDGNVLRHAASFGRLADGMRASVPEIAIDPGSVSGVALLERRQIAFDNIADPELVRRFPATIAAAAKIAPNGGSQVVTPLLREGQAVGAIVALRDVVRPFTEKELAQLRNFADQAVIAIGNAQLLNELHESLERQTATAEILRVIASTPGDSQRALATIAETAVRLFGAADAAILTVDGAGLRIAAIHGVGVARIRAEIGRELPLDSSNLPGAVVLERRQIYVPDLDHVDPAIAHWPGLAPLRAAGRRSVIGTPLMREDQAIGALMIIDRGEAKPFGEREMAQIANFADQAVIAIENARLLAELRESLERQTATADILRTIATSPAEAERSLDTIAETAARIFGASHVGVRRRDGDIMRTVSASGPNSNMMRQAFPNVPFDRSHVMGVCAVDNRQIHVEDTSQGEWASDPLAARVREMGIRTSAYTPLSRGDDKIGAMVVNRSEVRPFQPSELELMRGFADQAVIAIENARLLNELHESLERQTATAEILRVIASAPGDSQRALATIAETAVRLFGAADAAILTVDGAGLRIAAIDGAGVARVRAEIGRELPLDSNTFPGTVVLERRQIHMPDIDHVDPAIAHWPGLAPLRAAGRRASIGTPLMREGQAIGALMIHRREAKPFGEREMAQIANFADQAVIAIENARLLAELRDSLDRQTATADILRVIASTPGDPTQALQTIAETAARIFGASSVGIRRLEGDTLRFIAAAGPSSTAIRGAVPEIQLKARSLPGTIIRENRIVHIPDVEDFDPAIADSPGLPAARAAGARTIAGAPLRREGEAIGALVAYRDRLAPFTADELALLQSFADQAVIAIENARLLTELRERTNELGQRQAELRVTFDNMGDGVVMFDGELRLAAWNRNLQEILDLPDAFFAAPRTYRDYISYLIERGEFGAVALDEEMRRYVESTDRERRVERTRPDGRVLEVRVNPVPRGGFVAIYSDITERKKAEEQVRAARDAAEATLRELKAAQANLIQAEKMASLGQLTAGIAHEIKNPLNFVNNFAGLSVELLDELKQATAPAMAALDDDKRGEIDEVVEMLTSNLEKIAAHGKRADGIVKSMLAHSRGGSGERQDVNLNGLVEEALNLAYHGARAQDKEFNISLERDYGEGIAPLEMVPQDVMRVFLNLFGNGFYAANKRRGAGGDAAFRPVLRVTTREDAGHVVVIVRDNGIGIPPDIKEKLFQPFFTTKPTGEGTGLGLSISYEIVTRQHGGTIEIDSRVGEFTEFTIRLPRRFGATAESNISATGERS